LKIENEANNEDLRMFLGLAYYLLRITYYWLLIADGQWLMANGSFVETDFVFQNKE